MGYPLHVNRLNCLRVIHSNSSDRSMPLFRTIINEISLP